MATAIARASVPGTALNYVNETADVIEACAILTLGDRIGVAGCEIAPGQLGSVQLEGAYFMPKGSDALELGQAVGWNGSEIVPAGGGAVAAGFVIAAADADASEVLVKINA